MGGSVSERLSIGYLPRASSILLIFLSAEKRVSSAYEHTLSGPKVVDILTCIGAEPQGGQAQHSGTLVWAIALPRSAELVRSYLHRLPGAFAHQYREHLCRNSSSAFRKRFFPSAGLGSRVPPPEFHLIVHWTHYPIPQHTASQIHGFKCREWIARGKANRRLPLLQFVCADKLLREHPIGIVLLTQFQIRTLLESGRTGHLLGVIANVHVMDIFLGGGDVSKDYIDLLIDSVCSIKTVVNWDGELSGTSSLHRPMNAPRG
nr:hypothetical protein Iba_chr07eCG4210 [Ipomoea batatas]